MPKTCLQCEKELGKRKTKFCSARCKSIWWNHEYKASRLLAAAPYSPEESIQAFLADMFRVMVLHGDAVKKILERKRK